MQALHFTYGIGSFVAPLICEPFLSTESVHSGGHGVPHGVSINSSATTTASSLEVLNHTTEEAHLLVHETDPLDFLIYIPYAIAGAITVLAALIVLGLYYYKKYEPPKKANKNIDYQPGGKFKPARICHIDL